MRTHSRLAGVLVLAALGACAPARGGPAPTEPTGDVPQDAQPAVVVRVVDGDTLLLRGTGPGPLRGDAETRVRLLEVDAPESVTPDAAVECYGPEAAGALRALAPPGSVLSVAADVEPTDRFGRALRYAWTEEGTFVNEALVRDGYAESVLIGRNDRFINRLRAAERAARDERVGMWEACG